MTHTINEECTSNGSGFYVDGMPNEDYHNPEAGYSTSTIKDFIADPASVVWGRNAPQDKDKMAAIDFGTDFHSYFLEPDVFKQTYRVLPPCNRKKLAERQAELVLIDEWKESGIIPVTTEDMQKLEAMRQSALANPTVKRIMTMENSVAERSYFWKDEATGLNLKCRPDWLVEEISDNNRPEFMEEDEETLVVDIKTIAGFDRMQNQIEQLKYWIQDPFYSEGVGQVTGTKVCFVFVFVSTVMSLGRFPVRVVKLSEAAKFDGSEAKAKVLSDIANCENWETVVTMDRPMWAVNNEEILLG